GLFSVLMLSWIFLPIYIAGQVSLRSFGWDGMGRHSGGNAGLPFPVLGPMDIHKRSQLWGGMRH
ncbi:Hypothetical predicted protein, partial [Marmota monax]